MKILNIFKRKPIWIYGTCLNREARKHRKKGNVQMKLWQAGEQDHKEDYWHDFDSSWWPQFKENDIILPELTTDDIRTFIGKMAEEKSTHIFKG